MHILPRESVRVKTAAAIKNPVAMSADVTTDVTVVTISERLKRQDAVAALVGKSVLK
jgi:hypothetical protein